MMATTPCDSETIEKKKMMMMMMMMMTIDRVQPRRRLSSGSADRDATINTTPDCGGPPASKSGNPIGSGKRSPSLGSSDGENVSLGDTLSEAVLAAAGFSNRRCVLSLSSMQ